MYGYALERKREGEKQRERERGGGGGVETNVGGYMSSSVRK